MLACFTRCVLTSFVQCVLANFMMELDSSLHLVCASISSCFRCHVLACLMWCLLAHASLPCVTCEVCVISHYPWFHVNAACCYIITEHLCSRRGRRPLPRGVREHQLGKMSWLYMLGFLLITSLNVNSNQNLSALSLCLAASPCLALLLLLSLWDFIICLISSANKMTGSDTNMPSFVKQQ